MKTLVFLKTHFINDFVLNELGKMRACDTKNHKTVLFIDNHVNILNSEDNGKKVLKFNKKKQDCFILDEELYKELNLPYYAKHSDNLFFSKLMWYCCDYPFYLVRKYYPDYDYYWQIESDVFMNGENYKPFFQRFKNNTNDLLLTNYIEIDNFKPQDGSRQSDEWIYDDYKRGVGMFMVVRMSKRAIDYCYKRRLEHAKVFEKAKEDSINKWVYCEYFAATECRKKGFTCASLGEENLRFLPKFNIETDVPKEPNWNLYHPIKS